MFAHSYLCYWKDVWVSDLKSRLTMSHNWNKVYQTQWIDLWTNSYLWVLVCMYWTHLVLFRPAASVYSARQLKNHVTGRQQCYKTRPLPWLRACQSVSNSYVLSAKQGSRTSKFNVLFNAAADGTTNIPHASRTLNNYTTRRRSLLKGYQRI